MKTETEESFSPGVNPPVATVGENDRFKNIDNPRQCGPNER
jgi:hypothetical protein